MVVGGGGVTVTGAAVRAAAGLRGLRQRRGAASLAAPSAASPTWHGLDVGANGAALLHRAAEGNHALFGAKLHRCVGARVKGGRASVRLGAWQPERAARVAGLAPPAAGPAAH